MNYVLFIQIVDLFTDYIKSKSGLAIAICNHVNCQALNTTLLSLKWMERPVGLCVGRRRSTAQSITRFQITALIYWAVK